MRLFQVATAQLVRLARQCLHAWRGSARIVCWQFANMNHHWAFLRKFENFVPFKAANSIGFPSCGRLNWAFSEEFFIFVPFSPASQPRIWQEKGTKIRKWQENAQMAEIKSRKTQVFLPLRGTNFQKTAKNAQL